MEKSEPLFLSGKGAEEFAREMAAILKTPLIFLMNFDINSGRL
ncbi:isoaspartyl peptidase/L-asparaginase [Fulvivirga maritima]|nr:isoaspartyl peptidase/L-asparaginase [Fulvivirga maritima]UII26765.1 isoaspartyl peptidase/L-asparaginase [Fulvivirga maritima]